MKIKVVCTNPEDAELGKYYLHKIVLSWNIFGYCLYNSLRPNSVTASKTGRLTVWTSMDSRVGGRFQFGKIYKLEEAS